MVRPALSSAVSGFVGRSPIASASFPSMRTRYPWSVIAVYEPPRAWVMNTVVPIVSVMRSP